MEQDLELIFVALKNGPAKGININPLFEDREGDEDAEVDYREVIFQRAVNEGFAEIAPSGYGTSFFGSGNFLRLSFEAKGYRTYQDYLGRHKRAETVQNIAYGNGSIIQGSSFRDFSTSQSTNAAPSENEKKQSAKVSSTEKVIVTIIVGVVIGVILLLIEHKTGFFTGQ